ncbi:hypothetical protein GGF42_002170, partial [Coemansia sp. RSA 2424]
MSHKKNTAGAPRSSRRSGMLNPDDSLVPATSGDDASSGSFESPDPGMGKAFDAMAEIQSLRAIVDRNDVVEEKVDQLADEVGVMRVEMAGVASRNAEMRAELAEVALSNGAMRAEMRTMAEQSRVAGIAAAETSRMMSAMWDFMKTKATPEPVMEHGGVGGGNVNTPFLDIPTPTIAMGAESSGLANPTPLLAVGEEHSQKPPEPTDILSAS